MTSVPAGECGSLHRTRTPAGAHFLFALALCCDPLDLADQCAADGRHDAEIEIRTALAHESRDPLDWFNLAAALRDAGYPVRAWFEEIAARTPPWDPVFAFALDVLAEEAGDPAEACAIRAQVNYLRQVTYGQDPEEDHAEAP